MGAKLKVKELLKRVNTSRPRKVYLQPSEVLVVKNLCEYYIIKEGLNGKPRDKSEAISHLEELE